MDWLYDLLLSVSIIKIMLTSSGTANEACAGLGERQQLSMSTVSKSFPDEMEHRNT